MKYFGVLVSCPDTTPLTQNLLLFALLLNIVPTSYKCSCSRRGSRGCNDSIRECWSHQVSCVLNYVAEIKQLYISIVFSNTTFEAL